MNREILEELGIKEEDIKKLRKRLKVKEEKKKEKERKANFFIIASNALFRNLSLNLSQKKFFKQYMYELRKANIPLLLPSYLSLTFFITLIALILSISFSIFISFFSDNFFMSFIRNLLFSFIFTLIVFLLLFFYPKIEIKNIERKIDAELPFAALYMASIAGSGVQPIKALTLLSESREYREVAKQISKITNKINVLGMDVVTAIKESKDIIANKKLVEMFNGLATNITTGGDLKAYLEEEAKKFLTDYKISREKFTTSAGVYADIYTGLLIAAPLIFMLVLVLINLFSGSIAGFTAANLAVFGIFILILLNIIFLVYLQIVTPPI